MNGPVPHPPSGAPLPDALAVDHLEVAYCVRGRERTVLRDLSFRIGRGESYGLVGESGCGKSTVALAVVRYLPRNGRVRRGGIRVDDRDLLALNSRELRRLRANSVSMVYQDPGRALNPSLRIGRQLVEVFEPASAPADDSRERVEAMLARVQIADPARVMESYPHQLSGGMQQRVVIAMALATDPSLLILDEPTTGLDATVEAEVLDLVTQLRGEFATSVLFISHNLAVIAEMCDRIGVLYAGTLVEEGAAAQVFEDPRHPYTVGLLRCLPRHGRSKDHGRLDTIPGFPPASGAELAGCVFADRCGLAGERCVQEAPPLIDLGARSTRCHYHERASMLPRSAPVELPRTETVGRDTDPVMRVAGLAKTFRAGAHTVPVLRDVALELRPGETLGLVGESGSGKTTLARVLLGLTTPDTGSVLTLQGDALAGDVARRAPAQIKALQIVFQNPDSALNRSHTVRRLIGRALTRLVGLRGERRSERLSELTRSVQLADRYLGVRPSQLSGGLKQRVAIARAFAGAPEVVVCDEPTSALDVSVQAAILNLLAELQVEQRVSYVFISHDLGVVRYLSDRIAVLYLGRLMEIGTAEQVFSGPHHPYTEALLSAVLSLDGRRTRIRLEGEISSAANPPGGCVFHTRCPRNLGAVCEREEPPFTELEPGHAIRCHISLAELRRLQTGHTAPASSSD